MSLTLAVWHADFARQLASIDMPMETRLGSKYDKQQINRQRGLAHDADAISPFSSLIERLHQ